MFTACHALYGPHEEEKENFPAGANPCFNAGSDGDTEIPRDFRQDKWKPIKAKLTGVTQLSQILGYMLKTSNCVRGLGRL